MQSRAGDLAARRRVCEDACRAAGELQRRYYGQDAGVETKGGDRQDMLTRADLEGQEAAKAVILTAYPDATILGEEDGAAPEAMASMLDGACWTVDPLDGTQSFVHGFPFFGPGVAYVEGRQPLASAVYLPVYDELFSAARGLGATLNGEAIAVRPVRRLADALVGLHIRDVSPAALARFLETAGRVLPRCNGARLLGSPMIAECYVAAGRMDAVATLSPTRLGPWDQAPGALVLLESGGVAGDGNGGPFDVLASGISGASTQELLAELFAAARGET